MQRTEKYDEKLNETMKNFAALSDTDVIVGKPILTPCGTTVIPVSKMTVAMLSGNGEYGKIKLFQSNKNYPQTGASGGIASVKPCGFLIEKGKTVRFIHCPMDTMEKVFDSVESFIKGINEE